MVMAECDTLVDFGVWPATDELDFRAWLSNFKADEEPFALALLSRFIFYNRRMANALFASAVRHLANELRQQGEAAADFQKRWRSFVNGAIFTYVEGESPNPTDSGFAFTRIARQELGVDEARVLFPSMALRHVLAGHRGAVIFVDDFVGTGNQFVETLTRLYKLGGASTSFQQAFENNPHAKPYYCNAVSTSYGLDRLAQDCPGVFVSAGNVVDERYNLTRSDSILWPENLKHDGPGVLKTASDRAGIPPDRWMGYHDLGLALAFEHSTPDASLPIIYWEQNGWKPLKRRV
jgi:hypothetical protein